MFVRIITIMELMYCKNRLLGEKKSDPNEDVNRKLLKAARILERMVNQNTYNDIALGILIDYVSCAVK